MPVPVEREKVQFVSGNAECAAWHYPGTNGGCVIMTGGFAVTKEPGTDLFAKRFSDAGFAVLAFEYRHLGESGGQPRQVQRVGEQLADWQAAIACARTLPGVDPARLAIWGFSLVRWSRLPRRGAPSGARRGDRPDAERRWPGGRAQRGAPPEAARDAPLHRPRSCRCRRRSRWPPAAAGAAHRGAGHRSAAHDAGCPGRRPSAQPRNRYPDWRQEVAARSALRPGFYRPGREASRARCPLLVLVCDQDQSALAGPAVRAANRAPRGELIRIPGGHYEPFLGGHEQAVEAELSFLRRHSGSRHSATDRPERRHRAFHAAVR